MASHRAGRQVAPRGDRAAQNMASSSAGSPAGGKRRATKPARTDRKRVIPGLPSTPVLIGAAALVVAAAGAVSVAQGAVDTALASGDIQKLSGQANVLNGASSVGSSDPSRVRKLAVSRDSVRRAHDDAAREDLQALAEAQFRERNVAVQQLAASAEKHAAEIARNTWHLPVSPSAYHLTSRFGECSGLWAHCHTGLDFAAPTGTPIYSIANGIVTSAGYDGSYGNKTVVLLEDGTELWYAHQTSTSVGVGDRVTGGQPIGYVGSTGNTTGPHVHVEVRPGAGDPVDPYSAFLAHGVKP